MIKYIINHINKSQFLMSPWSILHHSFIIRGWLYRAIKQNAHSMTWTMMDFWCGEKPYQSLFKVDTYIWVDYEKTWHNNTDNPVDVYRDGKTLPFDDNMFDSVLASEVFEHVFTIDDILQEIRRTMKAWWKLLITIPFAIHEHEVPYDFARYTSYGIKAILERNGYKIISIQQAGSYRQTILQLMIRFLWKITETNYTFLTLILRIIIVAPLMIIINILSLISPHMQSWMYLSNVVVAEKI